MAKITDLDVAGGKRRLEELPELMKASKNGDLQSLHHIYSDWLARQEPNPNTENFSKRAAWNAARAAAENDQPTALGYFLSQGLEIRRELIAAALRSESTRTLQRL